MTTGADYADQRWAAMLDLAHAGVLQPPEPEPAPMSAVAPGSPLGQDQVWKARDAKATTALADLGASHRRNLLAFLRRNAQRIELADALSWLDHLHGWSWSEAGADAADAFGDELAERDPHEWLEGTPLVRRLVELVAHDTAALAAIPEEDI